MCTLFVQVGHTGLLLASFRGHTDVVATLLSAPGVLVDSANNEVCAHERVGRRFVCGFIYSFVFFCMFYKSN